MVRGAEILLKANDLPLDAVNEYDAAKPRADDMLKTSLPFLEKAYEKMPDDMNKIVSLKEKYMRLGMMEKLNEINAILQK